MSLTVDFARTSPKGVWSSGLQLGRARMQPVAYALPQLKDSQRRAPALPRAPGNGRQQSSGRLV